MTSLQQAIVCDEFGGVVSNDEYQEEGRKVDSIKQDIHTTTSSSLTALGIEHAATAVGQGVPQPTDTLNLTLVESLDTKATGLTALGVEATASQVWSSTAQAEVTEERQETEDNHEQQEEHNPESKAQPTREPSPTYDGCTVEGNSIDDHDANINNNQTSPVWPWWTSCTDVLHRAILVFVVSSAQVSARRPWTVVIGVCTLSVLAMAIGLATNFVVVFDPEEFLIPYGTPIEEQYNWVAATFADSENIEIPIVIHKNGGNVVTVNTTRKVLEVMDAVFATSGYDQVCSQGDYVDIYGRTTCWSYSVGRVWDYNISFFDDTIRSDLDVMQMVSHSTFPYGGTPVAHDVLLGNHHEERLNGTSLISYAQSYSMSIELPYKPGVEELEFALIQTLYGLRQEWSQLPDPVQLEFMAQMSIEMEVESAIRQDLPLIPLVMVIMGNFCSVVFFRRDKTKSRCLLGYGAVITIVCSISTGFGILFIVGVPVSSLLLVLPFVIFGVGLDDTFIITASYLRTEHLSSDIVERITVTMRDIGLSCTLTTITTIVAFFTTGLSSIRAVQWLGWYASLTIFIDFLYQITFYVALLVLDERRIQSNRRDVCCWIVVPREPTFECPKSLTLSASNCGKHYARNRVSEEVYSHQVKEEWDGTSGSQSRQQNLEPKPENEVVLTSVTSEESQPDGIDGTGNPPNGEDESIANLAASEESHGNHQLADRAMRWYAGRLLPQSWFQMTVNVIFLGYFALCCYHTSLLKQEFKTQDFVPHDSYVASFLNSVSAFVSFDYATGAYFRDVNQSDPAIQDQMRSFLDDLSALPHVSGDPPFCWVQQFPSFQELYAHQLDNLTVSEQIKHALSIPALNELYGPDIIIDHMTGEIVASRCWMFMRALDVDDVQDQLEFYDDQNEVAWAQPINANRKAVSFFANEYIMFLWEFFSAIERELTYNTISGFVSVGGITILLIPHWSAICFVLPLVIILYIDFMGTIQLMGLHVDSMSFVCIIISVGLVVDYLMHVILRYYESPGSTRLQKVQGTLTTMGASILLGGLSTCLAVLPLAFGTSMVVRTVFLCFFALVCLGVSHGLVFLPVVLCMFGPVNANGSAQHVGEANDLRAPSADVKGRESGEFNDTFQPIPLVPKTSRRGNQKDKPSSMM